MQDADAIAKLCAKGHSEAHAVAILAKFSYRAWVNWKSRGRRTGKIGDLFTRTLAARVDNLIEQVSTVADIDRARKANVRHDWRAARFLAGVVDPRFAESQPAGASTTTNIMVLDDGMARRMAEIYSRPMASALPAGEQGQVVKQLADATQSQDDGKALQADGQSAAEAVSIDATPADHGARYEEAGGKD